VNGLLAAEPPTPNPMRGPTEAGEFLRKLGALARAEFKTLLLKLWLL
jgi:hypothetical protein